MTILQLSMRRLLISLLAILPAVMASPALADETPFLVPRFTAEQSHRIDSRNVGLSGAVYALSREGAETSRQSLQLAYNADDRPVLMRLVQVLEDTEDTEALASAAVAAAALVQPDWAEGHTVLHETLRAQADRFLENRVGVQINVAIVSGATGTLQIRQEDRLAVLDLPVDAPASRRLTESDIHRLVNDSTVTFEASRNDIARRRYHGPDGRFGGGSLDGVTQETGTWSAEAGGLYCVETAPIPERICHTVFRTGPDRFHAVPVSEGTPVHAGMRAFRVVFGNPGRFVAPRLPDSTPAAVTQMIVTGRTEERRFEDGRIARVFLDSDGRMRGSDAEGERVEGIWSVLTDGRCCVTDLTETSECAFLSETAGGTFRLYDAEGRYLGEALHLDGNPNGL